mmetsp:Transcript_86028/g.229579  ORF Transcript_86028/g.229579 Transcript_86028/m.229579 type:complete len:429 (+) Transcript_86028:457-1743(+)
MRTIATGRAPWAEGPKATSAKRQTTPDGTKEGGGWRRGGAERKAWTSVSSGRPTSARERDNIPSNTHLCTLRGPRKQSSSRARKKNQRDTHLGIGLELHGGEHDLFAHSVRVMTVEARRKQHKKRTSKHLRAERSVIARRNRTEWYCEQRQPRQAEREVGREPSREAHLVPGLGGLVHVPVIPDVGDGAAGAGVALGGISVAVAGESLDGRLAVLVTQALAETDLEHGRRLGRHIDDAGAVGKGGQQHALDGGVVLVQGVGGHLEDPREVLVHELAEGARAPVAVPGVIPVPSLATGWLDVVPEIGVDEFHGDERSSSEDKVISIRDVVAEPLGNVGVGVPDRHVVLHRSHKHSSAARLREITESLASKGLQEMRVAVFSAGHTSELYKVANVVTRVAKALVRRISPIHPEILRGRPGLGGRSHLKKD